jgi:hypothetical protein
MSFAATGYRIFIASPSDVATERGISEEVINEFNIVNAIPLGKIVLPVRWETHAVPELGARPQEVLNRQLVDASDIVIGIFWTRLGSPTGQFPSGSVEEIERAHAAGKPCMLYFSQVPVALQNLDQDEWNRLNAWRESLQGRGLYHQYSNLGEFRTALATHLLSVVRSLPGLQASEGSLAGRQLNVVDATTIAEESRRRARARFTTELRNLETLWKTEVASNPRQISDGQQLLSRLASLADQGLAVYDSEEDSPIRSALAEVVTGARRSQDWRVYLDGGKSFRGFFDFGTALFRAAHEAVS